MQYNKLINKQMNERIPKKTAPNTFLSKVDKCSIKGCMITFKKKGVVTFYKTFRYENESTENRIYCTL